MALVLADRVLETTTSTGSGTITLAGAEPGYQSFAVVGNANQTYYTIAGDTEWEVGIGTYTSSGTTLSRDTVLSSSDSGNKVTFSAGQKKVFVTYPSEKSVNRDVSGNISASSAIITNLADPVIGSDAANKAYVDNVASAALHVHEQVVLATPANSGRNDTYNNGTAGVSATLTATANGTLVIDSTVAQAAQRVLIKDCDDQVENGVYVVTTVGDGSNPYVMTRSSDADTSGESDAFTLDEGSYFFVTGGTTQKGAAYVCNTSTLIIFGTTSITFAEFSQAQVYSAGNGISLTNTTISLDTPVSVANGGTGLSTTPTSGQLLIGNGSNYTLSTLTAGSGVSITNSAGSITLSATGLGGTVTAVTATGPLASSGGTTPDISIANSTGTGSVVLDQGATISSATITAAASASITTITGTSANITTVTGTTAGFSSANITQLGTTSATIATLSGTNVTYSSGTVSQLAATSATIATVSGTNVTYSNGNFTSATVTTVSGTTATYTSATVTNLALTSLTLANLSITSANITTLTGTNLSYGSLTLSGGANITGNVGIGTASPGGKLHTTVTDASTVLKLERTGSGATDITFDFSGANYVQSLSAGAAYIWKEGGAEHMRLDASGNVGIGTTSPSYKFQVNGGSTAQWFLERSTGTTVTPPSSYSATIDGFLCQVVADGSPFYRFTDLVAGVGAAGSVMRMFTGPNTGAVERMRIDSSGNVGIGTASPAEKLAVLGNIVAGNTGSTADGYLDIDSAAGKIRIARTGTGATASGIAFYTQFSTLQERMRITDTGNVGVGTTSPTFKFVAANSGTDGAWLYSSSAISYLGLGGYANGGDGAFQIIYNRSTGVTTLNGNTRDTPSTRMTFDNNGNVGIGTAAPTNFGGTNVNVTAANNTVYASQLWTSGAYVMQALVQESGSVMAVGARSNHHFSITTNDTERARFSAAGGFSVGTTADPGAGGIFATANITAYYSDARLKDFKGKIGDALYKVSQLNGYYYTENEKAEEFGYNNKELQVGVSAQEVQAVLPEVVTAAPFDLDADGISKSGEDYMTVRYEKLVPLLIEAIKELKAEVEALKAAK